MPSNKTPTGGRAALAAEAWAFDVFREKREKQELSEVVNELYEELYSAYFSPGIGVLSVNATAREKDLAPAELRKILASLEAVGHLTTEEPGPRLTARGARHCERSGISRERREEYEELRYRIMKLLEGEYDQHGPRGGFELRSMARDLSLDRHVLNAQVKFLAGLGFVDTSDHHFGRITQEGLSLVEHWRDQEARLERFAEVEGLEPAARGRKFQKVFSSALEEAGWSAVEGLRTSNEEIDVFLSRGREFYLVECKWLKEPVEAGVVRELHGKVRTRAGVNGVLASMSSFTEGARVAVQKCASDRLILLFGEADVRSIIDRPAEFESLLEQKIVALVMSGEVIYD